MNSHARYLWFISYCLAVVYSVPIPSQIPTFSPTLIPTDVKIVPIPQKPIAPHQLVVVESTGDKLIQLSFYDPSTTLMTYSIQSVPKTGTLYQLSQVFSNYGYEPKAGVIIQPPSNVTGSQNRIYYKRPTPDQANNQRWGTFDYTLLRQTDREQSFPGTITIVPPSGALVGSNFLLSNENWFVVGNKAASTPAMHERYSRGPLMNYYISGSDDIINVATQQDQFGRGISALAIGSDKSKWYFVAPSMYSGNWGIAYGGKFEFNIASFAGDFTKLNDPKTTVVELYCAECNGPVHKGILLGFTLSALQQSPNGPFMGGVKKISIPLNEHGGWLKDSQDTLVPWMKPTKCDIIQVLSRLTTIRILGDWTTWYETVAIDNVQISNLKNQLPICAMSIPDASICTC